MNQSFKVVVINILVFIFGIASLEFGSRFFLYRDVKSIFSNKNLHITGRPFVQRNKTRGFSLTPNFSNNLYHVNSRGFRGKEFPPDFPNMHKILALGESTTFGWGVAEGNDYPSLLMHELQRRLGKKDLYVINAGVPSYTSSQVHVYLNELLDTIKPDCILISILWNDIWYSTLFNWYPGVLIHRQPSSFQRFMIRNSNLYRIAFLKSSPKKEKHDIFNEMAFEAYRENIEKMIVACRMKKIPIIFIEPPLDPTLIPEAGINPFYHSRLTKDFYIKISIQYNNALKAIAGRYEAPVINHRISLTNAHGKELFIDFLHPNSTGNLIMAQDISDYIVTHNLIF